MYISTEIFRKSSSVQGKRGFLKFRPVHRSRWHCHKNIKIINPRPTLKAIPNRVTFRNNFVVAKHCRFHPTIRFEWERKFRHARFYLENLLWVVCGVRLNGRRGGSKNHHPRHVIDLERTEVSGLDQRYHLKKREYTPTASFLDGGLGLLRLHFLDVDAPRGRFGPLWSQDTGLS